MRLSPARRLRLSRACGAAFNFTRLKFMGLNLDYSIDKAKRELGYHPRFSFADGMAETMAWYKKEAAPLAG